MDAKFFVEEIQKITNKRIELKDSYEKCCNDSGLSLEDKKDILNNFEVAYESLGILRERMLKNYMNLRR